MLTIAQISGTSSEMIEQHYGHLVSDAALKAWMGSPSSGPNPTLGSHRDGYANDAFWDEAAVPGGVAERRVVAEADILASAGATSGNG
jgi:hypothetical protein